MSASPSSAYIDPLSAHIFCNPDGSSIRPSAPSLTEKSGSANFFSGERLEQEDKCRAHLTHPSYSTWAKLATDGKLNLDAASQEMFDVCQRVPPDATRRLQSLLSNGATHPWVLRSDRESALHLAVVSDNEQLVSILLHAGASCNARNLKGQTPLHLATMAGASSVLKRMIDYSTKGTTPQPELVDVSAQDAIGCSPLHLAAYVGNGESCEILLRAGANSLAVDNGGRVPLHHCTSIEVVTLLANHEPGAVRVADASGMLPSHYAVMRNLLPVLNVLVQYPGGTGPDMKGMQPLHYAVIHDCSNSVVDRMCIACDVNASDGSGHTALDYCIFKGDGERAELMVKNGARMDPVLLLRTRCQRLTHEFSSPPATSKVVYKRTRDGVDLSSSCMDLQTHHDSVVKCFRSGSKKPVKSKANVGAEIRDMDKVNETIRWMTEYNISQPKESLVRPERAIDRYHELWKRQHLRSVLPAQEYSGDNERVEQLHELGMQQHVPSQVLAQVQIHTLGK